MGKTFRHKLTDKQAADKYGKQSKNKSSKFTTKKYFDEEDDED